MKETHQPGETLVVRPGEATSFWQPVPANGHIEVALDPSKVHMDSPLAFGTQTVAPRSHVREHSHDRHEEVIHIIRGKGRAKIDGEDTPLEPGTTLFIGKSRRHMFINDSPGEDLHFCWVIAPNGIEDFFRLIGRPRKAGDPAPENFPRPENVLEIERQTVFAAPPADPQKP